MFTCTRYTRLKSGFPVVAGAWHRPEAPGEGVLIELIDGERLVSLFEKYELGLKPKTVYELVPEFFRSFES